MGAVLLPIVVVVALGVLYRLRNVLPQGMIKVGVCVCVFIVLGDCTATGCGDVLHLYLPRACHSTCYHSAI